MVRDILATVNMVIFAEGKFHENVGKIFHVGQGSSYLRRVGRSHFSLQQG